VATPQKSAPVPSEAITKPAASEHAAPGRTLRVGIDIRRLGEFGVGTYTRNLLRALGRVGAEEEYVLIGRSGQFEELGELPPNFQSEIYPHRFNAPSSHVSFSFLLRRLALDVFHMPHRWVPYFTPGPYVATLHDIDNVLYPPEDVSNWTRRWNRFLLINGLKSASRVIVVSEATKRDAVKHLGVPAERLVVVPNAIDEDLAKPVRPEERVRILDRYQIHDPFVLYAGRIRPHKNIPRLIEAFAVVKAELENDERYRNLRLIIIGDELSSWPEVRYTVRRTRVQQWVRFLGFVPIETLRVFYASARAFLFPSLYEGFGLPPLEAMAHGTSVVASSVSSLPEVIGEAAETVNPENVFDIARGLRRVLLDDEHRARLRELGLERARRFSWDRSAAEVLKVYRSVIQKEAARP